MEIKTEISMEIKWFIESWSVRDGFAFASQREKGESQSLQTSFISPPYFDPIPINNVSTALNAARMHFQAGLWIDDEQEAEFDTLDQIIELVRRSYIKGGTGLDGPPEIGDGQPRPPVEPEGPRQGPEDRYYSQQMTELVKKLTTTQGSTRKDISKFLQSYLDNDFHSNPVVRFASDSTINIINRIPFVYSQNKADDDNTKMSEVLITWFYASSRIYPELRDINRGDFPNGPYGNDIYYFIDNLRWYDYSLWQNDNSIEALSRLLFCIPIDKQWTNNKSYDSLGDYMCTILADREILQSAIQDWNAFVPIIFCALLLSSGSTQDASKPLIRSEKYSEIFRRNIKKRAAEWLSQAITSDILDSKHESIISDLDFKPRPVEPDI